MMAPKRETVGWGFVRVVEVLENMKAYDWVGAICATLMESIKGFYSKPKKVIGRVTALLFWICEHTNLIKADRGDGFLRFMKWNISKLVTKIRAVDFDQPHDVEVVVGELHMSHFERTITKANDVKEIGANAEYSYRSGVGGNMGSRSGTIVDGSILGSIDGIRVHGLDNVKENVQHERDVNKGGADSNGHCGQCASTFEEYQKALGKIGVPEIELCGKCDVIFAFETQLSTMRASNDEKCRKLPHEYTLTNNQKDCEIERMKQLVAKLNDKNPKLVDQLEEYTVHEYTQAAAGVQGMKQCHPNMYHCETNILDIMPLSTLSPSNVNGKAKLRGVDTHVTPTHEIGHVACDVDIMPAISQTTGITIVLQNSLVRNIKNKNRKEHKLPEYEYPLVLGRLKKPPDGGVVDVGECANKKIMHNEIIEVDELVEPERTFSWFDLTNRLPIWKLLST